MTPTGIKIKEKFLEAPQGNNKDTEDDKHFRWGRDRHTGFNIGKFLNMPPMFFTRDRHPMWLTDLYRGVPAFLIASGPSFAKVDKSKLNLPGILTFGINNSPKSFRPDLWCCVDNPQNFMKSIWLDPRITKFTPICHAGKRIFDNETWQESRMKVGDCPNVIYYSRNEKFNHLQYLFEDTINWGCGGKIEGSCGHRGCRSVLLAAIRILFLIGVRYIFLLGTDFKMEYGQPNYHFEQGRSRSSVKNNNNTYAALNDRFAALQPIFLENGLKVYNTVEDSGLKAFPFAKLDDAIDMAQKLLPDTTTERTKGMYERQAEMKKQKNKPCKTLQSFVERRKCVKA